MLCAFDSSDTPLRVALLSRENVRVLRYGVKFPLGPCHKRLNRRRSLGIRPTAADLFI